MISIEEALQYICKTVAPIGTEVVSLENATGRVLSKAVCTDVNSPPHSKSVMDGFAVIADDIEKGKPLSVIETVPAGAVPTKNVVPGTATRIMTGAPIPEGADAVVMIEQTAFDQDSQQVTIQLDSIAVGQHIMNKSSSMTVGDKVFSEGHQIRPQDIGLLAESGAAQVDVFRQPSIAVMATGDELVSCDQFPGPGMIRNSNGPMLVSLARQQTNSIIDLGVGRDDRDQLREKVSQGLECDFLIMSGGVSAGILDLVPEILTELGVRQVFHKVAIKPGKPIWFGALTTDGQTRYVFGLPGNPVSSLVGFNVFVRAALACQVGGSVAQPERIGVATLTADHEIRGNRRTYWPVHTKWQGEQWMATPVEWRGSSDMRALGKANGLAIFDPEIGSLFSSGTRVQILSLEN